MKNHLHVGIDVGSTTIKIVIMDDDLNVLHEDYQDITQIQKTHYAKF